MPHIPYVVLRKSHEDERYVTYFFGPNEGNLGQIRFDKLNGETDELQPVDIDKPEAFFLRAMAKLRQHWRGGEFPERSYWSE